MDIFDDGFSSEDDYEVENIINEMFGSEVEDDVDLEPEEDSSEVNSTGMWNATRCLVGDIFSVSKVHQSCRRINTTIV